MSALITKGLFGNLKPMMETYARRSLTPAIIEKTLT
jgi:hypothetical protein